MERARPCVMGVMNGRSLSDIPRHFRHLRSRSHVTRMRLMVISSLSSTKRERCLKLSKVSFGCSSAEVVRTTSDDPGVLVECDPSIKAIILKIDQEKHDFIVEDLDDQSVLVKESQLQRLKSRLEEALRHSTITARKHKLTCVQELANTQQMPEDSGSD